ncbi:MAG: IS91 family transposase [Vicinamibacteria bacterium]
MGSAAAPLGSLPRADTCPAVYRPRNPRATSLYQLLDTHFETLKRRWEERFEPRYGSWRDFWDSAVFSYLDCGVFQSGFARVVCPKCRFEFLVAFSCKGRGLCPSWGAKRAVLLSELLQHKILADVPHAQWVFTLPKMLRPYFLFHRELLGALARLAFETVREVMAAAADESEARPGMVAVIQTFGSSLKWNPHIHAVVTRGVLLPDGTWHPIPYVDSFKAELVLRHKILGLLRDRDLITQERIELLLSWRNSGFGVHNRTTVYPQDSDGLHKLARYLMRPPVNLSRLRYHRDSQLLLYEPKPAQELDEEPLVDPLEFLARVLIHIPEPQKHLVHFYGVYANRVRETYRGRDNERIGADGEAEDATPRRTLSKRWRELIYRIYEVDPLDCHRSGARMKILAFLIDPNVIRQILDHLGKGNHPPRAPPDLTESSP